MNKKGFTLVELLGVIIILALIALIATPMVSKIIKEEKQESYEASLKMVLNGAKKYVADNSDSLDIDETGILLTLDDLYNGSYISTKNIVNPSNNVKFEECVLVKWETSSNQYSYSFDADCSL